MLSKDIIRSKFYIDPESPDRFVTIKLYVKWKDDNNFSVLRSRCRLKQGDAPCTGNPLKPCMGKYNKCNAHDKSICGDELGKLNFISKDQKRFGYGDGEFPSNVTEEWAKFEVETYGAFSYIQAMSRRMDKSTLQMVWDQFRNDYLTIQVLLKDWSLSQYHSDLVLQPTRPPDLPFTMLSSQQMSIISRVAGSIVDCFLDEYRSITRE